MESKYEQKIENLMQENYQLKSLVEEFRGKEEWYKEEIAQLEQATSQMGPSKSEKEFKVREQELKDKVSNLRLDLELAQQSEKSHQERITELESLIKDNQKFTTHDETRVDCDETMGASKDEQISLLMEEIKELKDQITENQKDLMKQKIDIDRLRLVLETKEEELSSVKSECTSYSNLLEKARTENLELNTQLDALLMQAEEQTHEKKGNSLFSELDDRRVEAEKTLMSQKKTFDMMKQKNEILRQHNSKLKMKLFAAMGRGNEDTDRVQELEQQLETERTERKNLMEKLRMMEDQQAKEKVTSLLTEFTKKISSEKGVDKDYIEYLVNMLKSKEEEVEDLSMKLHVKNMCLLDQKNKVAEKEKQLYSAEAKKDEMYRKFLQMKMEKDEMEMELKPEKKERKLTGRTEKIPLGLEGVEEKNVSILHENTSENEYQSADKEWAMSMMRKWQEEEKKPKSRSVRMSDDVDVFEADGQINITTLKDYDIENERPLVREKPAAGKVTKVNNVAGEPKYKLDECNTQ